MLRCFRRLEPATVHRIQVYANGVSGRHETREIRIGSKSFLRDEVAASNGFQVPDNLEIKKEFSTIYMSYAGMCCAVLVFGLAYPAGMTQMEIPR